MKIWYAIDLSGTGTDTVTNAADSGSRSLLSKIAFLGYEKAPGSWDIIMSANATTSPEDGGVMMIQALSRFGHILSELFFAVNFEKTGELS